MKKILGIITLSILLIGCNINPSKEARIQKLEAKMEQAIEKINQLEGRIESLEKENTALQLKVAEIGNQES